MPKLRPKTDLRTQNPVGRVDVAAYRIAEHLGKTAESKSGLTGLWDHIESDIQDLIHSTLGHVGDINSLSNLEKLFAGVVLFGITQKLIGGAKSNTSNSTTPAPENMSKGAQG